MFIAKNKTVIVLIPENKHKIKCTSVIREKDHSGTKVKFFITRKLHNKTNKSKQHFPAVCFFVILLLLKLFYRWNKVFPLRKLNCFHAIFVLISCFNLVLFGYMPPVNPYIIYSFNKFQNSKLRTPQFIKVHASTWSIVLHYKTYTTDNRKSVIIYERVGNKDTK